MTEDAPATWVACVECGDHRGWRVENDFTTGEAVQVQCRACTEHVCPDVPECTCDSMGGRFGAHRPECPWQIAFEKQAETIDGG